MSFPENLKRIRIEKGMSQQALAKAARVSQTAIYHWEKGLRVPKIGSLNRVADVLDVSIDEFFKEIVDGKPIIDLDVPGISENELHEYLAYIAPEPVYILKETKFDKINELFDNLNDNGQDKAIEQVELLTKIPEYRKESDEPPKE